MDASTTSSAEWARELAALRSGAGWAADPRDRLDLTGADRVRFLHNLVTCEVRELAPGRAVRGYFTHSKGGVLADVEVVALEDRLRLVLPTGRGPALRAHLEKYRIVERVEFEERLDLAAFSLRGARAPELFVALGLRTPEAGERLEGRLGGAAVAMRRALRGREPRFELEATANDSDAVSAALVREATRLGGGRLSDSALDCARIEEGELLWGVDYGEEYFPQETGDEEAVSYTKGCYLGQEIVARIHYRGGVQRRALGLRFSGGLPALGSALLKDGREAGRATSATLSPGFGPIGLAIVHRRAGEPPAKVDLAGGDSAELVALPFVAGRSQEDPT